MENQLKIRLKTKNPVDSKGTIWQGGRVGWRARGGFGPFDSPAMDLGGFAAGIYAFLFMRCGCGARGVCSRECGQSLSSGHYPRAGTVKAKGNEDVVIFILWLLFYFAFHAHWCGWPGIDWPEFN